jgi:hypothetical protein
MGKGNDPNCVAGVPMLHPNDVEHPDPDSRSTIAVVESADGREQAPAATPRVGSHADAQAWMAAAPEGAWTGIQYHGTTEDGPESLREQGVIIERCRQGGFYTTDSKGAAGLWGWGGVVPVAVRFDNPLLLKRSDLGVNVAICNRARDQGYDGIIWPMGGETVAVALTAAAALVIDE